MTRIKLISMPFVAVSCPSISLTQVAAAARRALGDRVSVEVLYLSHDFARRMGIGKGGLYDVFCGSQMHTTGLGDWFFRQVAFPDAPDNADEYFARYYPGRSADTERFKAAVLEQRAGLGDFLDELVDRYRIDESDIVGFTSMFQQNAATFALARRLKERSPDLTVVMGGANCEDPMGREIVAHVEQVDYVFSGPALLSFPAFVERHRAGDSDGCSAIPGVLSKARPVPPAGEQIGRELDIDTVLELDYADFFESLGRSFPAGIGSDAAIFFETSRGCWWGERAHCTFCGLNGLTMEYRSMQPQNAVELLQGLLDRYSDVSSYFFCVDNIMPRSYVKEVLPRVDVPPGATIFYEVKADLDEEEVRVMAEAGVRKIQPGIESMATSTLKLMKKGTTVFTNIRLLKLCAKYGVQPQWNLLVGFPGEGADVYEKYVADLGRLVHLQPPDGSFPVRFDRFSPYYTQAAEYGLSLRHLDYYGLTFPFGDEALANMAYYFTDTNFDAEYIRVMVQWLGRIRRETGAWRERWEADRPKLFLRRGEAGGVVYDSRGPGAVEHPVTARQVAVLASLERPRRAAELGPEVERDLEYLDERRLVWREKDRWMSLALPAEY